jgi:hypothetical protein
MWRIGFVFHNVREIRKSAMKTFEVLSTEFVDQTLSSSKHFTDFKPCDDCQISIEDGAHLNCPSTCILSNQSLSSVIQYIKTEEL